MGPKNVLLSSWFSNTVEKVDRKTGKLVATLGEFAAPVDAVEFADGTIYVAELASGNLVKVSADGKGRSTVMKELRGPVAMVHGAGPLIYITEISAGVVTEIDVARARAQGGGRQSHRPGIDLGPDGKLYVAEVGQKGVVSIDPPARKTVIASNLDIGLAPFPGGPPAARTDRRRGRPHRHRLCQRRHPELAL